MGDRMGGVAPHSTPTPERIYGRAHRDILARLSNDVSNLIAKLPLGNRERYRANPLRGWSQAYKDGM